MPRERLAALLIKTHKIALLKSNWDSYNAPPASPDVLRLAQNFLLLLKEDFLPEVIGPIADGVYMSWGKTRIEMFVTRVDMYLCLWNLEKNIVDAVEVSSHLDSFPALLAKLKSMCEAIKNDP